MRLITENAHLACLHALGRVQNRPSQELVRIDGNLLLVEADPEGRDIKSCPNMGATIKPCQHTLRAFEGYSSLMAVDRHAVCLSTVRGLTDGTPPGVVEYEVRDPGQALVGSSA
jgi:hypothetical protein